MTRGWCCQQEMELRRPVAVSRHPSLTIFLVCLFISSQHLHSPPLLVKSAEGRSLSPARLLYGGCQGHTGRRWRFSLWKLHNRCDNCRAPGKSLVACGSSINADLGQLDVLQRLGNGCTLSPSVVAPTQGQHSSLVSVPGSGHLFLFGGYSGVGRAPLGDLWSFHVASVKWA